jgi:hypothetical protein
MISPPIRWWQPAAPSLEALMLLIGARRFGKFACP